MESHDERVCIKNITNTNGSQNAKNPITALERTEALAVLMVTTPDPKIVGNLVNKVMISLGAYLFGFVISHTLAIYYKKTVGKDYTTYTKQL